MKKIKIIFESENGKIGYVINPDDKRFISCDFNDNYDVGVTHQDDIIVNPKTLVQQITAILMSVLRN